MAFSETKNSQQDDDTEYVNLTETQKEKIKSNQYQQIGDENSTTINQVDNESQQQIELESQDTSDIKISPTESSSENIYSTSEINSNLPENKILKDGLTFDKSITDNTQQAAEAEKKLQPNDNVEYQTLGTVQDNISQSSNNSTQSVLDNQDGQVVSDIDSQTRPNTSNRSVELDATQLAGDQQNKIGAENQITYRTLQPGQDIENKDGFTSSFDTITGQVIGGIAQNDSVSDTAGETFVPEPTYTGVTGEKQVAPAESFGVVGQTEVSVTDNFGVTGEKIVLNSSPDGVKGETSVSLDNQSSNGSNDIDQAGKINENIYKQVGPDGQIFTTGSASATSNETSVFNGNQTPSGSPIDNNSIGGNQTSLDSPIDNNSVGGNQTPSSSSDSINATSQSDTAIVNANKLTFDKMSSTDSIIQSVEYDKSPSGRSDLGTNDVSEDKVIYGSLPEQEKINLGSSDNSSRADNQPISNSTNTPLEQAGIRGETTVLNRNIEGVSGDKTVTLNEYSSARGENNVSSREVSGVNGETSVNFSDTNGISGTTGSEFTYNQQNNQQNNQQTPITPESTRRIVINRSGTDNNQTDSINKQTNSSDDVSKPANPESATSSENIKSPKIINISNVGQNPFSYEDIQNPISRRQLAGQQEESNQQGSTPQKSLYKTITDSSGNTYQVDEYGNKINESDFSYEELQEDNLSNTNSRAPRYSTVDGVRTTESNNEYDYQDVAYSDTNQDQAKSDSTTTYQTTSADRANQNNLTNQNNRIVSQGISQAQSVYSPLTGNPSRLTKSDGAGPSQRGAKNYNFIQKLSMTINRALGIEPQSVKDEVNLNNTDSDQEFSQSAGPTRIVSPRVTGLLETENLEDEEEERNNKRKRLRYKRVGYVEPDLKAPEPIKLDDETQAFQDLYGERSRFDNVTGETNSALLRMAEEEIEKQSEVAKESNSQESQNAQPEINQDVESVYYIELMKERARLEQALDEERESNRLAIRKSEDNIQQQLLDLILNNQNTDIDSRSDDPINQIVQSLIADDKNKNSEQVIIDATRIVQMIQNQITESNGKPIDEYLLRKRIEEELKSEFIYMQKEQEKKMKLVYKKMLEDMYMDMINN